MSYSKHIRFMQLRAIFHPGDAKEWYGVAKLYIGTKMYATTFSLYDALPRYKHFIPCNSLKSEHSLDVYVREQMTFKIIRDIERYLRSLYTLTKMMQDFVRCTRIIIRRVHVEYNKRYKNWPGPLKFS